MHKLHLPVAGEHGCAFWRIFNFTMWSALHFLVTKMCLISDVANDLCLSLMLDVCRLYRVFNSFSVIHMYYVFLHCVGLWDGGLVGDTFCLHTPFSAAVHQYLPRRTAVKWPPEQNYRATKKTLYEHKNEKEMSLKC